MSKQNYVQLYNDTVKTTSLVVAEIFEKEHKNVLRDIENLDCSHEFSRLNFEPSTYKARGKEYPFFFITRDGFSFLAMGYTGTKAAQFKETFIAAFNRMEQALRVATTPVLLPTYQQRILSEPTKACPSNRWCVFDQSSEVMFWIEKNVGSVSQFDLVDGSIGSLWVKFREGKEWRKTVTQYYHEHRDVRGKQLSNCYEFTELEHFKVWLKNVYMREHLFSYLQNKFKKDKVMIERVKAVEQKLIGGSK